MSRHIRSHTNSNTSSSVTKQKRKFCWKNRRFHSSIVKVRNHIYRFFVDVRSHFLGNLRHLCFGITVSCRRVTGNSTKVTLRSYSCIPLSKILTKAHKGIVNRGITMRMIMTQNFTDNSSTFFWLATARKIKFIHSVHNSPVNRFKPIPNIRQGTLNNYRHRIIDISLLNFIFNWNLYNSSTFRCFFFI